MCVGGLITEEGVKVSKTNVRYHKKLGVGFLNKKGATINIIFYKKTIQYKLGINPPTEFKNMRLHLTLSRK